MGRGARRVALVTRGGNRGRFGEECADERKKDFKRFSFFWGGLFKNQGQGERSERSVMRIIKDLAVQEWKTLLYLFLIYMFFLDRMADEEYEILFFKQINTLNSQLSW